MDIETIINLFFSLIFGYESFNYFIRYFYLRKNGINTIANVVDVEFVETSISHVYYSTISFKLLTGEVLKQKLKIGFSLVIFKMYTTLRIIYSEKNPNNFVVDDYRAKIISIIFFIASIIHLYFFIIYL